MTRWSRISLILLGVLGLLAAAGLLYSTFMVYDDEGYVLYSLQAFVELGGLYERVYSQYGPFFFLFNQALHACGLPFSSDGARLITLANWLATAVLCGSITWRLTRSAAATALAASGVFLHLWMLINEPSHPGGLIATALALLAWLGIGWTSRPDRLAAAAGGIGAALVLTKINVGAFVLAGAGAWWLLHLDANRPAHRVRVLIAGFALAALPFALMRDKLALDWVFTFASIVAASGVGVLIATSGALQPVTSWKNLRLLAAAGGVVGLATAAAILAQGSSLQNLLEGVILGPLRHPNAYSHHVAWRPGALVFAVGSLLAAGTAAACDSVTVRRVVAGARLVTVAVFVAAWALTWHLNTLAFVLSYGLAATWLFVFPLGTDAPTQRARAWLALLLVPQTLHAYPVAGSQIGWGTFLWIPLAIAGAHDAIRFLLPAWTANGKRALAVGAAAILTLSLTRVANYAHLGMTRLKDGESPGVAGTTWLRIRPDLASSVRVLSLNARAHADLLFSLPGLLSFHQWTGVPPPTSLNATHWFTLLSPAQQEDIRSKLEASPRSCLILQRHIYDFLGESKIATESPLTLWLKSNYEQAFAVDSYEFWVRKGRKIAPLGTAIAREAETGVSPRYRVGATVVLPAGEQIASWELRHFRGDIAETVAAWPATEAKLLFTPITSAGSPFAEPQPWATPLREAALVRVDILTDAFPSDIPLDRAVLVLRNPTGERIAEARFVR